jgi:D-arabinose 1-dehydrogenase-like Zn-dependent alcohol dehydrogenase
MLNFAAAHKIETAVETLSLEQANEALHKLRINQTRYRIVLTVG